MPSPRTIRRLLPAHLRRHGVAYAALAVALSLSPVPSMAAGLVHSRDLARGAVTAPKLAKNSVTSPKIANGSIRGMDLKNGTVTTGDLAPGARGSRTTVYDLGAHDFAGTFLSAQLPGTWTAEAVAGSSWSASAHSDTIGRDYLLPGGGAGGATTYRISISPSGMVFIDKSGPGEAYSHIRLYRTTATQSLASAKMRAPGRASAGASDR